MERLRDNAHKTQELEDQTSEANAILEAQLIHVYRAVWLEDIVLKHFTLQLVFIDLLMGSGFFGAIAHDLSDVALSSFIKNTNENLETEEELSQTLLTLR